MRQIIKKDVFNYETIHIPNEKRILECLKENTRYQFCLERVSFSEFSRIQKAQEEDRLLDSCKYSPIVGYNPLIKGDYDFRSSGGMKLSSDDEDIFGSFVIEDDRIIYTPLSKFYEERDCFVYFRRKFYTTISMPEILEQELIPERQLLLYRGEEMKDLRFYPVFENISRSEMMEYATNPEKGKEAYQKRLIP